MTRIVAVLAAVAGIALANQVPAMADTAPTGRLHGTADAQLATLQKAGVGIKYRKATPADPEIPGAYVEVVGKSPQGRCVPFRICLYTDANGAGLMVGIQSGTSVRYLGQVCVDGVCYDINDQMTSWENASAWTYCWYYDAVYSGTHRFMEYYGSAVQNVPSNDNDQASSLLALAPTEQRVRC